MSRRSIPLAITACALALAACSGPAQAPTASPTVAAPPSDTPRLTTAPPGVTTTATPVPPTGTSPAPSAADASTPSQAPASASSSASTDSSTGSGGSSSSSEGSSSSKGGASSEGSSTTKTKGSVPASSTNVDASEVKRLAIPELDFDQPVTPMATSEMGGAIDPPYYDGSGPQPPIRVSDKGVKPSSHADDTTYLACHTSTKYGKSAYPCDVLTRKVSTGDHLVLTTGQGRLTYEVTDTRSIPYSALAKDKQTWAYEPNRVVLIMCDIANGKGTGANYVVYANLV